MNVVAESAPAGSRGTVRKPLIRLGVSAALFTLLAGKIEWDHVANAFRDMHWPGWFVAVGVYLVAQVLSALRWQWLSRPLGFERPLRAYIADYFVGMFFNLLLPTSIGGDAVRAISLNGGSRRKTAAVLSVLLDRLSGLLVLLALACAAALACPIALPAWVKLVVASAAASAAVGLALTPIFVRLLTGLESQRLGIARVRKLAESLGSAIGVFRLRPGLVLGAIALSALIQASGVIQVALIGRAIGIDVPLAIYGVAVPMVALLTLLPISLNGMGVREAGMVLFLQPAGIEPAQAALVAFLWFCSQTVAGLAGGVVYSCGRSRRPEVRHDDAIGHHPDQGRTRQSRAAA